MAFTVPTVRPEPRKHTDDCYISRFYYSDSLPVAIPTNNNELGIENEDSVEQEEPNKPSRYHDLDFEEKICQL